MDPHGGGAIGLIVAVLTENQIALIEVHRGQTDQLAAAELAHLHGHGRNRSKAGVDRWGTSKGAQSVSLSVGSAGPPSVSCPSCLCARLMISPLPFPSRLTAMT